MPTKRNIDRKRLAEDELNADILNEFFVSEPLNIVNSIEDQMIWI